MIKNQNIEQLRCVLCMIVFVSHLKQAMGGCSFFDLPVISLLSSGGFAVSIFFVLSGYFYTHSFYKMPTRRISEMIKLIVHRLKRLYFLPCISILLCIILYFVTPRVPNGLTDNINAYWTYPLSAEYIVRNLILVHYVGPPMLNFVLWTIAKEMTMAFEMPLLIMFVELWGGKRRKTIITSLMIVLFAMLGLYTAKVSFVFLFLTGTLIYYIKDYIEFINHFWLVICGAVGLAIQCLPLNSNAVGGLAVSVIGIVLLLLPFFSPMHILPIDTSHLPLGEFSFSLYCVHPLSILFWRFICWDNSFMAYFTYFVLVFVTTIVLSFLFIWIGRIPEKLKKIIKRDVISV